MSSIDLSALVAVLGAYYRENNREIRRRIFISLTSPTFMKHYAGVVDELPLHNRRVGSVVQPYQKGWTPKEDVIKDEPRMLKVRPQKIDLVFEPHKLRQSWLGELTKRGTSAEKFPLEEFIWDDIIKRIAEDIEMRMIWKGVYSAPTPGTAGSPEDGMDGLLKLIADEITGGTINPVITGPITQANAVSSYESVYDALPERYKSIPTYLFCSPTNARFYNRDYRDTYGANTTYNEHKRAMLDGTDCDIVPIQGLASSNKLIVTPQDNFAYGYNQAGETEELSVQLDKRMLCVLGDFLLGVNFHDYFEISTNDQ